MSLRARIILVLVVVAIVPLGIAGAMVRTLLRESSEADYHDRLVAVARSAETRVEARMGRDRQAIQRLCAEDILIDRLMLDLEAQRFGPALQQDLIERLPNVMRSMGLVALSILDGRPGLRRGRVLAAGHFPGRAGARERELIEAAERAGEGWFVHRLHLRREGETVEVEALLTGCLKEREGVGIWVIGGHALDRGYLDSIAGDVRPVELRFREEEASGRAARSQSQLEVWRFTDLEGAPVRTLVAVIDDAPLRARLREIDRALLALGGLALLAAIFIGFLLAVGITRPLTDLEGAAERVAEGDLGSTVSVTSGGEVGRALSAFNRMTRELREARERLIRAQRIAAWRDIARRIAHEIKNPLMPIQTSIETMRKTHARKHPDFDEIFEESTLTILEEVERLKRIVTEFSRFARLPRPRPMELDVRDVLAHVVGLHAGGEVEVSLSSEEALPEVRADREQLTQVFVNLVQNAADAAKDRHGSEGARVKVIAEARGEGVDVRVEDNGPGLSEEERARVFEPYYTTKPGGTGLGLAIVHRIVMDHGGELDVERSEAGGASFVVHLTREGPPKEAEVSQTDADLPLIRPPKK